MIASAALAAILGLWNLSWMAPLIPLVAVAAHWRLHDLGWSGKWLAVPLGVAVLVLVPAAAGLIPGAVAVPLFTILAAATAIWLIVLGLVPGQPGANRYGGPPGRGFG